MTEHQISNGWKLVKFGDIAEHISERINPTPGDEKAYIGLEHLDTGSLTVNRWGSDVQLKGQKLAMKKGDILFAKRNAYLKRVALAPFDGIFSAHGMVIRPKGNLLLHELLPFFVQSDIFLNRSISISEGSLSPTIKWKTLANQSFCIPDSTSSQRRLYSLCKRAEKVYVAIRNAKDSLLILEAAFRNSLGELACEEIKLSNLADYVTSGSRGWSKYFSHEGSLFLRSQNIRDGYLDLEDSVFVDLPEKVEGKRTNIEAGDIVFTITGNSVGNVSLVGSLSSEAYVSQHVALVKLRNKRYSKYISYYFTKGAPGNKEIQLCQYGQSKPGLNLKNINEFKVKVPSEVELGKYDQLIDSINSTKNTLASKEHELDKLKKVINNMILKQE